MNRSITVTTEAAIERGTVLVVDDDDGVLDVTRAVLQREGYEVLVCKDGREALHILTGADDEPCLVFLDLNMPVMDGWQLLGVMRSYTRLRSIPIVLVTGNGYQPDLQPKVEAILQKPVAARDLVLAVKRWRSAV